MYEIEDPVIAWLDVEVQRRVNAKQKGIAEIERLQDMIPEIECEIIALEEAKEVLTDPII